MRFVLVLALALAGCWRGRSEPVIVEPAAPAPVRVKGASCDEAADNARKVLENGDDTDLAARAEPLTNILRHRCSADGWSMELRRCLTGAPDMAELDGCEKLATDEQQTRLEDDLEVFDVSEDGQ